MAQIISFPNSAAAPVQQQRGPGRHPKMVVQLWKWRSKTHSAKSKPSAEFLIGMEQGRRTAEQHLGAGAQPFQRSINEQLEGQRELLLTCEYLVNNVRQKIALLQQQCAQTH